MSHNVWLIYGDDAVAVLKERTKLLDRIIEPEFRIENLTDIDPPTNRALELERIGAELISELGTLSFFPEARRVVVVNDLVNLGTTTGVRGGGGGAKKRKKKGEVAVLTPAQRLVKFLDRDLPETPNALVFIYNESYEKRRKLSKANPIVKFILAKCAKENIIQCSVKPLNFKFSDAILAKNLELTLKVFREMTIKDGGQFPLLTALSRHVRFLIQAKLAQSSGGLDNLAGEYLPAKKGLNLAKEHPFVQNNYMQASRRFSLSELNNAMGQLVQINKTLYPLATDVYVADWRLQIEMFLIELCGSR